LAKPIRNSASVANWVVLTTHLPHGRW